MSRARIESAASDWVARRDAGLTAEEEKVFQAWLAEPAHARAFTRHEKTFRFFARPAQVTDGNVIAQEIRQRVARRRRRRLGATLGMAALLLVAAGVWSVRSPHATPEPAANVVVVRPTQQVLPDGSVVEFRPGAQIAADFTAAGPGPRLVRLLAGEAHFRVAKDKTRPFIVAVDNVEVRAVGTAFSVERSAAAVEVVVSEGTVALDHRVASALVAETPNTLATLTAGERAVVDVSSPDAPKIEPLEPGALAERLAWRSPRLEFTSTPLPEAIRRVNEFNPVKFELGDPELSTVEVTGYFRAGQPDTFLVLLEQGFGVRGERHGETIVLRKVR